MMWPFRPKFKDCGWQNCMDCYLRGSTKMQPKIVTVLVCARTKQEDGNSSTSSKQTVSKSGVQSPYIHFPSMYIIYFGARIFWVKGFVSVPYSWGISRTYPGGTVRYKSNKPRTSHATEGWGPVQWGPVSWGWGPMHHGQGPLPLPCVLNDCLKTSPSCHLVGGW